MAEVIECPNEVLHCLIVNICQSDIVYSFHYVWVSLVQRLVTLLVCICQYLLKKALRAKVPRETEDSARNGWDGYRVETKYPS